MIEQLSWYLSLFIKIKKARWNFENCESLMTEPCLLKLKEFIPYQMVIGLLYTNSIK